MKVILAILMLGLSSPSFAQKIKKSHKKEIKSSVKEVLDTIYQTEISPEANRREATFPDVSEKVKSLTIEQFYARSGISTENKTIIKLGDFDLGKTKAVTVTHKYSYNDCSLSFKVKNGYIRDFIFQAMSVDKIDVLACFNLLVDGIQNDQTIGIGTFGSFNFGFGYGALHNEGRNHGKELNTSRKIRNTNSNEI